MLCWFILEHNQLFIRCWVDLQINKYTHAVGSVSALFFQLEQNLNKISNTFLENVHQEKSWKMNFTVKLQKSSEFLNGMIASSEFLIEMAIKACLYLAAWVGFFPLP
jgi:hypothetical protein